MRAACEGHARLLDEGSYWRGDPPKLLSKREYINVARTRSPTYYIAADHRWGQSLAAVAAVMPPEEDGTQPRVVDACLVFPRLNDVRFTRITDLQCPNVLYERVNATHWQFKESRALPFKARPL